MVVMNDMVEGIVIARTFSRLLYCIKLQPSNLGMCVFCILVQESAITERIGQVVVALLLLPITVCANIVSF